MEVKQVPIRSLKPWPKNPRANDDAVDALVRSIEAFGYTAPILIRKADREIIAGHTRVKAARKLGMTHVPAIILDLDEQQAHAYALFDNKSVENVPWDMSLLAKIATKLQELDVDINLTGFTADEIKPFTEDGIGELGGYFNPATDPPESEPQAPWLCPYCGKDIHQPPEDQT